MCSIDLGSIKCNIEMAKIGILLWENVSATIAKLPKSDFAHKNQFLFPVSLIHEIKSMQISFKSVRIFVTIRGKTWQVHLGNCQNRNSHTSKIVCLLPVCLRNNWRLADHISEPYAVLWKMVTNCVCNRSRLDEIDTKPKLHSLKSEFYFRFVDHRVQVSAD